MTRDYDSVARCGADPHTTLAGAIIKRALLDAAGNVQYVHGERNRATLQREAAKWLSTAGVELLEQIAPSVEYTGLTNLLIIRRE